MVKLQILVSHCLPTQLYGCESGFMDDDMLSLLNCCWNSIYRKIFGYFRWESVRNVMGQLNKLNVVYLVSLRRFIFIKKLAQLSSSNKLLSNVVNVYSNSHEFQTVGLLNRYNVDFYSSIVNIKNKVHSEFLLTCK